MIPRKDTSHLNNLDVWAAVPNLWGGLTVPSERQDIVSSFKICRNLDLVHQHPVKAWLARLGHILTSPMQTWSTRREFPALGTGGVKPAHGRCCCTQESGSSSTRSRWGTFPPLFCSHGTRLGRWRPSRTAPSCSPRRTWGAFAGNTPLWPLKVPPVPPCTVGSCSHHHGSQTCPNQPSDWY